MEDSGKKYEAITYYSVTQIKNKVLKTQSPYKSVSMGTVWHPEPPQCTPASEALC